MKADKRRRAGVANDGDNIAGDEAGEGGGGVVALRGGRIGIFSQQWKYDFVEQIYNGNIISFCKFSSVQRKRIFVT